VHRLAELGDEQLVGYLRRARAAERHDAMKPAVAVLVHGYWDILVGRARLKLRTDADAEEVAAEAVASAIASAFAGSSVGEFRSWLHTILSRRIADWWEGREQRLEKTALPSEHLGDEEVWGREPSVGFEGDALFARDCIEAALAELEDERHRAVIERYVFGPGSALEAAATVGSGMTEANVHQIASRFQRRVRELLERGDTSG
jgi:DNA-directed RNA polymerase specialized sigma24 family protein